MKKILVPCDFSKPAVDAFRFALDVAHQSEGTVSLLNVVDLPVIHDPIIMPVITFDQDFLKEMKQKALLELAKITAKYKTDTVVVMPHIEFGSPWRMITGFAAKHAMDVIIMGSHGTSGIREYITGSNAEKVVRHATVPVLVTKDYYTAPIKDIVFPNNLETTHQEALIMRVKSLQEFFKATVHIVYINTPANFTSDSITLEKLQAFATHFKFNQYTINVYNYPNEENGIIQFTRRIKGNLITMGTHGRSGISHFFNGSLAEDVVNHTDCPIWTYAAHDKS